MTTQTIQLIDQKAREMYGRKYIYNGTGEAYAVKGHQIAKDRLLLSTDKKLFDVEIDAGMELLSEFHSGTEVRSDIALVPPTASFVPTVQSLSGIRSLTDILMENIKKVQGSPDYIGQAAAVNDTVKTIIELAKVEIRACELRRDL